MVDFGVQKPKISSPFIICQPHNANGGPKEKHAFIYSFEKKKREKQMRLTCQIIEPKKIYKKVENVNSIK